MLSSTMTPPVTLRLPQMPGFEYSDSRLHGGPPEISSNVRMQRVSHNNGLVSMNEEGTRCVVAGHASLRIVRVSPDSNVTNPEQKHAIGEGGHRIDASRNYWDSTAVKTESVTTDVVWCTGLYKNKILSSTRSGEILVWDVHKTTFVVKFERKLTGHTRSINILAVSRVVHNYAISGSADGDVRVWDLRDYKCILFLHHPAAVRSAALSPCTWNPLQLMVGLDNGAIYRWDLVKGKKGLLDRVPMAHSGPILAIDWKDSPEVRAGAPSTQSTGQGWVATGGIDRTVKIWDLTAPGTHARLPLTPAYTLYSTFPIRRLQWRPGPGHECELVMVSNAAPRTSTGTNAETPTAPSSKRRSGSRTRASSFTEESASTSVLDPGQGGKGDSIEIWDVRRPWIPKWALNGSSVEGGVTDIDFNGPYAIWAQHASGAFSQLDVRDATRPMDSIPRCAASWDASEALVFVADHPAKGEVPYDDLAPELWDSISQKKQLKNIGNATYKPHTQLMGTYVGSFSGEDLETFAKIAKTSVVDKANRQSACLKNASIAEDLGKDQEYQTWMRMACLLEDLVPDHPPTPPPSPSPPLSRHYVLPVHPVPRSDIPRQSLVGLGRPPHPSASSQRSTTQKLTPSSSKSSSPHPVSSYLPSPTPRQPSLMFARRDSDAAGSFRPPTLERRYSIFSTAPSDGVRSSSSLRNVGEGALSDSSGSEDDGMAMDTEEDGPVPPEFSRQTSVSSPLSQLSLQQPLQDNEEEEEDASPSPRSTDSEASSSSSSPRRRVSIPRRRNSTRVKSRSRSSTVASFAASNIQRQLNPQVSYASMRTVTAGDENEEDRRNDIVKDIRPSFDSSRVPTPSSVGMQTESMAMSMSIPNLVDASPATKLARDRANMAERKRFDLISAEEEEIREEGWKTLREDLEAYAGEGAVQICTLMVLIAAKELQVKPSRVGRFLDAYIDILKRLKLHTSIAYLRKESISDEIRAPTKMETIVYTACGKCRRPVVHPLGHTNQNMRGMFSYCADCKDPIVRCSICHIPVRSLLFHCSVCMHGGHIRCLQMYYMKRPMVDASKPPTKPIALDSRLLASAPSFASSDSSMSSDSSSILTATSARTIVDLSTDEEQSTQGDTEVEEEKEARPPVARPARLEGHPCASGCGHICWAANMS